MTMTATRAAAYVGRLTGRKPHVSTVIRWITRGVRGRKLPAYWQGGVWMVADRDLDEFVRVVNAPAESTPAAIQAARIELERRALAEMLGRSAT